MQKKMETGNDISRARLTAKWWVPEERIAVLRGEIVGNPQMRKLWKNCTI
jgi:hypothetical protein